MPVAVQAQRVAVCPSAKLLQLSFLRAIHVAKQQTPSLVWVVWMLHMSLVWESGFKVGASFSILSFAAR